MQEMAKKKVSKPTSYEKSLRTHRQVFTLNDRENNALNRYIAKYKIRNRSKLIREILMISIIKKMEDDSPTLFD